MIFTLIMIIWTFSSTEAGFLIQDVDTDLDDIKDRLSQVEKNLAKMETQMNEAKGRIGNLETKQGDTTTVPTPRMACLDGWLAYKGSCYYFGTFEVTFDAAEALCKSKGAYLVHVESQDENEFLKAFMLNQDNKVQHWLGITDAEKEGVWKLTGENTTAPFFDWGNSNTEPDGGRVQNCAKFASDFDFKWADVSCTLLYRNLCEQI